MQDDEMEKFMAKVADIEDCLRRKLRGVPESVQSAQLNQYACDLIRTVLPSIPASEIIIDRIHRLPKPSYLPANIPRDAIMRIHFYHVKDQLRSIFAKQPNYLINSPAFKCTQTSPNIHCRKGNRFCQSQKHCAIITSSTIGDTL